jgi:hypothetical protein
MNINRVKRNENIHLYNEMILNDDSDIYLQGIC